MKSDVLHDLPPKNISDRMCILSSLQQQLYDAFTQMDAAKTLEKKAAAIATDDTKGSDTKNESSTASGVVSKNHTHTFQALQYLRQLCSHPSLVTITASSSSLH